MLTAETADNTDSEEKTEENDCNLVWFGTAVVALVEALTAVTALNLIEKCLKASETCNSSDKQKSFVSGIRKNKLTFKL